MVARRSDAQVSAERFTKHPLTDRVDSSAGYSIRLRRDRIEYTDQLGTQVIQAEWSPGRGTRVMVFISGVPDDSHRRREDTLGNIARAFDAAGWHLSIRE